MKYSVKTFNKVKFISKFLSKNVKVLHFEVEKVTQFFEDVEVFSYNFIYR